MELDKANAIMVGEGYEAFSEFQEKFDILLVFNHEATEKCSQQATILGQVEQGEEKISAVTQENAASSEECSAISEQLAARATDMRTLMQRFKLY